MNIAEGDTSFNVSDTGVLTCKGAIIEGALKVSGGGITSTNENDETTFSVTAKGKMTCKGASISSAYIYKATISDDCEVKGILKCGGLFIGNTAYTPQTFSANFAFAPTNYSVLLSTTNVINELDMTDTFKSKSDIKCDFTLTADPSTGVVSGTIYLPEHTHQHYRFRSKLERTTGYIAARRILDGVNILADKSIVFNPTDGG
jgi:hypothetical protein